MILHMYFLFHATMTSISSVKFYKFFNFDIVFLLVQLFIFTMYDFPTKCNLWSRGHLFKKEILLLNSFLK